MIVGERQQGFLFVLPAVVVLAVFIAYPLVSTGMLSVTDARGRFTGLENYIEMIESPRTARATRNTIYYVGVSVLFQLAIGTAAGILLNERFRGQALMRSLTLIPWVVPGIVAAMTWAWMFHTDFGIINFALQRIAAIEEPLGWLTNPLTTMRPQTPTNAAVVIGWPGTRAPTGTLRLLRGRKENRHAAVSPQNRKSMVTT